MYWRSVTQVHQYSLNFHSFFQGCNVKDSFLLIQWHLFMILWPRIPFLEKKCQNTEHVSIILLYLYQTASWSNHTSGRKFYYNGMFKTLWIVTWAWLFLTSEVLEAVKGQKHYSKLTLWHLTQNQFISQNHNSNSTTKTKGLDLIHPWFLYCR